MCVSLLIMDNWWKALQQAANCIYELALSIFMYIYETIYPNESLHMAALTGSLNLCKLLIEKKKFDVHMTDDKGYIPLHNSALNGNYECFSYFADIGSDINLKTNDGKNCLHIAALGGQLHLCKMLVEIHMFDVNLTDDSGQTALHASAKNGSYHLFTYFAEMGSDINLKTTDGENCLHIAAFKGHLNLCKMLIEKYKFDVHMTDDKGCTALHNSALGGNYKLFSYFANMGSDVNLKIYIGMNCLHIAAFRGDLSICRLLVEKQMFDVKTTDDYGRSGLHTCILSGNYKLLSYFVDMGSDINLKKDDGENCLHIAAYCGYFYLCKMLVEKHNFDAHMTDDKGWTALHKSAESGNYKLFSYFENVGTDINLKTNDGKNCLHIATFSGQLNICKMLVEKHNFDVHMTDNYGWAALHTGAQSGNYELVSYFADMGTDINLKTDDGKNCLHIAACSGYLNLCKLLVEKHKFDWNMADHQGWTALHCSAHNGNYELVTYFADMGTDVNLKTNDGENCLHIAACSGNLKLCQMLVEKHKFDVHKNDDKGWTALHKSTQSGSCKLFSYFVKLGTDVNLKTNDGKNCLHIAARSRNSMLCQMLVEKHKFDVQMIDYKGWTAIHKSALSGSCNLFSYFANMGTDVNLKTNDGKNCLHIATLSGQLNIVKMLVEKHNFDVHMVDNKGWSAVLTAARSGNCNLLSYFADIETDIDRKKKIAEICLYTASYKGHSNLCKLIVEKYKLDMGLADKHVWQVLHLSALKGSYELVSYFADIGIDINHKTNDGKNCLHFGALGGNFNLCKVLVNKHKFAVSLADDNGWTALHFAAQSGSYELVKYFADLGAGIKLKTSDGKNCLHCAALGGHSNLCKTLINKHKFDVHMTNDRGWTALHFSIQGGSYGLVRYLEDTGTDINQKANDGNNCLHISALYGHLNLCKDFAETHNFDVNVIQNNGQNALHYSAENGSFDLFVYILGKGGEIYCKTNNMENVLHYSARNGSFDICEFVLKHFVKDYRENNTRNQYKLFGKSYRSEVFYKYNTIFLHAMDNDGNTYLHLAAVGNHAKVCELLLKYDTDIITLLNKRDESARSIALDKSHRNVLAVLEAEYDRTGMFFRFEFSLYCQKNLKTIHFFEKQLLTCL